MVHAKLLQKEKEIMSINYTATISMNYTTPESSVLSEKVLLQRLYLFIYYALFNMLSVAQATQHQMI